MPISSISEPLPEQTELGPRCGNAALELVSAMLPQLTPVDGRHRVWESWREIRDRAGLKSPGTVGTHVKTLQAVGVLVPGHRPGKYLVDTQRLAELTDVDASASEQPGRSIGDTTAAVRGTRQLVDGTPDHSDEAHNVQLLLLAALDDLTRAVELQPGLLEAVAPLLARLSRLTVNGHLEAKVFLLDEARNRAKPRDSGRAKPRDSGCAKSRETARSEERKKDLSVPLNQIDQDLSVSLSGESIARTRAIDDQTRDLRDGNGSLNRASAGRVGSSRPKRSVERLLELTAPFNPDSKLPYDALGILGNVEDYSDETIAYAAELVAIQPGVEEPFAYFRALARKGDPTFFPATPPPLRFAKASVVDSKPTAPLCEECNGLGEVLPPDPTANRTVPCICSVEPSVGTADPIDAVRITDELGDGDPRSPDATNSEPAADRLGVMAPW